MTTVDVPPHGSLPRAVPTRRLGRIAERTVLSSADRLLRGAAGVAVVLGLWEGLSDHHVISAYIWSSPHAVWSSFFSLVQLGLLGSDCWASLKLFLLGFTIAALLGTGLGVVLGWYRRPRAVLDPWVSMLYAAPRVGLIPIIIAAAGIAVKAQVIVVVIAAIFPVMINVAAGIDAVDRDHLRLAQSFLASNRSILFGIAIPGALPLIVAGLRQGLTAGLIGVVIAEYFVGNDGVGGLIITASGSGQTGEAFVGAFIFSVTALLMTSLLRAGERRLSTWRP